MGSSPVTATIGPSAARFLRQLGDSIERLGRERRSENSHRVLVAFSGGPDSLALLWGLSTLVRDRRSDSLPLIVEAAHFDHQIDPSSADRARAARDLATQLEVPFHLGTSAPDTDPGGRSRGVEADARRRRYAFLRRLAADRGSEAIATGHHADDQAETVLLRILFGTGIAGLAAMRELQADLWRPMLDLPRALLSQVVTEIRATRPRLVPCCDPANRDLLIRRNLVRKQLLPALPPETTEQLLRIASAAAGANDRIETLLARHLPLRATPRGPGYRLDGLLELPPALLGWALARLHTAIGEPYPPPRGAVEELRRQLDSLPSGGFADAPSFFCSAGRQLNWSIESGLLVLLTTPVPGSEPTLDFQHQGRWPATVSLPELGLVMKFERQPVADWMWRGEANRTALTPDIPDRSRVVVRSRRPGDRLRPLGFPRPKRLKELLIDAKVPRQQRSRLPVLLIEDSIAWVPGVTIDERLRLKPTDEEAWVVSLESTEH